MPQAAIELGFNVDELTPQQKRVVQLLTEVYDLTKRLDGIKVSPIDISGFGQLNKVVSEQNAILVKANQISADYQKQQMLAAKAAEANAKANTAITKSENEVIKQIELETKAQATLEQQRKKTADTNIPFTSNLNADSTINEPAQGVTSGTVVSSQELADTQAQLLAIRELTGEKQKEDAVDKERITTIAELTTASSEYVGSINANIAALIEDEVALTQNKAEQQELIALGALSSGATIEQTQAIIRLRTEQFQLNQSISDTRATIKNLTKEFLSEEGSINELRAQVNNLTASYEKMSIAEKGAAKGQELKQKIDQLQPALVTAEASLGKNQRKVGDYTNSITKAFTGAFSQLRQLAYIIPGLGIAGIFNIAFEAISKLVDELVDTQDPFKKSIQAEKDFAEQLENTNKLIKEQTDLIKDLTQGEINYFQNQLKFSQASGENQIEQFALLKRLNAATKQQADNTVESLQASYDEQAKLKTQLQSIDEQKQKAVIGIANTDKAIAEAQAKTVTLQGAVQQALEKAGKVSGLKQVKEDLTTSLDALTAKFNAIKAQYDAGQKALQDQSNADAAVEAQRLQELKFNDDERRKLILAETQIEVSLIEDKNKRILANDKSTLEQRLTAIKSNAVAENRLAQAQANNVINDISATPTDKIIAQEKANAEIKKNDAQAQVDLNKTREEYRLKDLDAQKDIDSQRLQQNADTNKKLADDDTKAFNIRISAQQNYIDKQKELEDIDFTNKLQHAGANDVEINLIKQGDKIKLQQSNLTDKQLEDLEKTHQNKLIQINTQGAADLKALAEKARLFQIQNAKDLENDIEQIYSNGIAQTAKEIDTQTTEIQNKLFDAFNKGQIGRDQLEKGLRDSTLAGQKKQLQAALNSYQQQLKGLDPISEKYTEIEDKIQHIQKDINNIDLTTADDKLKDLQDTFETISEAANNLTEAFQSLANIGFDNVKTELEQIGAQEDKNYENAQANIQKANLSDTDRAAKLQALDTAHAARQEEIARKQREEDNKKAEFDKAAAILNIIVSTAAAVVKALPNIPLAVSVGILGAAELTAAVATKVPHYAKGTQDHLGGDAVVAEAGKKELVQFNGNSVIYDKPTYIKNLPKHAKVIPLMENANVMANKAMGNGLIVSIKQELSQTADGWQQAAQYIGKQIKKYSKQNTIVNVRNDFGNYQYLNKNVFHRK